MIEIPERVKDALRDGRLLKNYRFNVLNDDLTTDFVIDNTFLVSESVKFDERMCSGSEIKFGLCEGSSLEFQYFNKPNINGRQLQSFVDVQYRHPESEVKVATLTQTNTTYTVLAEGDYILVIPPSTSFILTTIHGGETTTEEFFPTGSEESYTLSDFVPGDVIQTTTEYVGYEFSVDLYKRGTISWYEIPMGFFTVAQCPMQFSTGIRKVTAYNKLKSEYLDQKANELVLDSLYNKETLLSMYSIRQMLLAEYEITPYEEVEVEEGQSNDSTTTIKTQPKLTSLSLGGTPLNAYNLFTRMGVTPSTSRGFYITVYCKNIRFPVDTDKYYQIRDLKDRIGEASEIFADYLKKLINDAQLSVTGQQMVDDINTVWDSGASEHSFGWTYLSAATTSEWTGSAQAIKVYCDYAYKNGVVNVQYPIVGTVTDAEDVLITGKYYIDVYYPVEIWCRYYIGSDMYMADRIYLQHDSTYYDIDGTQKTYPAMKFRDGSAYTDENILEKFKVVRVEGLTDADVVTVNPSDVPDFTLRDILSASYETVCQFGKLDRVTDLFSGVELNTEALYPRDDLYPANDLYPSGLMDRTVKSSYSKLWTDTVGTQTFRYLFITYKGLDENQQEKEFTLQRTVNANGTTDYYVSDNWLFKNLLWTEAAVGEYADVMVGKMRGIKWFPFELWGAGLPYLETGDEIEIVTKEGSYVSYVLQRQLNGIQNLQDTFINGELDIF